MPSVVGVPKETKQDEYRVAIAPAGVHSLAQHGHTVLIEKNAGLGSGIPDSEFRQVGALIVDTPQEVFDRADIVVKVKEPLPPEYKLIRPGQTLFAFFHLAASRELTAAGVGAQVSVFDVSHDRLRYLHDVLPPNVTTLYSNPLMVHKKVVQADIVIGAVLLAGARAPLLVRREDLVDLKDGSVIVDVAVDQGGCVETTRPTTHTKPTFVEEGVIHYCVANMPGAVARTSTFALTNATLPYLMVLADGGIKAFAALGPHTAEGLNLCRGKVCHKRVAETFGLELWPVPKVLS